MSQFVKLNSAHMQSEATSTVKSVSMCTLSLDWNSRDFLLAKTCRWLETWRKTGWRERKERRGYDYRRKREFVQWTPTLMLLWYSRTLLRAKTWMWLDTYGAMVTPMRKKKKNDTHSQDDWTILMITWTQGEWKHYLTVNRAHFTFMRSNQTACREPKASQQWAHSL